MRLEVTIISDDLTGAADAGGAFAIAGLPTWVALGAGLAPSWASIVALDTASRVLASSAAAERVHAAARAAYRQGTRALYKKIDSTLRGHVGAELAATWRAATEALGSALLIVAPSFPGMGRAVRDGRLLVHGAPLESTSWRQPGTPWEGDLVAMLAAAGLTTGRMQPGAAVPRDCDAVICDAASDEELLQIARAGAALSVPVVWAGSAGLARQLPAALGLGSPEGTPAAGREDAGGPVLALVGSRSPMAGDQARALSTEPGIESFLLTALELTAGASGAGWSRAAAAVERALAAGRDVLLRLEPDEREGDPRIAAALGDFAAAHAKNVSGLVATGGDTARAALGALGASGLRLLGEVEAGVPIGLADTARPLRVITKAGAFGTPATLRRCRAALHHAAGPI